MATVHLIDGNALGWAAMYSTSNKGQLLKVGDHYTNVTFGLSRTMRDLQVEAPTSRKIVLWDGAARWRKDLVPTYKAQRDKTPQQIEIREIYKSQTGDVRRAMKALGIDQVVSPNCEADDLAAAYADLFVKKGFKVMLLTADRDWLQLVRPGVEWFDPVHDKFCNADNFTEITGFRDPDQFVDAKALQGDVSDNVKGVGQIGEVGAKKLLTAYGRVAKFLKLYDLQRERMEGVPAAWQKLAENIEDRRTRFFNNRKIMELKPGAPGVKDIQVTKGELDVTEFRKLCEELAFLSILGQFNDWVRPFTNRKAA